MCTQIVNFSIRVSHPLSDGNGFVLLADRKQLFTVGKPFVEAKIRFRFYQFPLSLDLNYVIEEPLSRAGSY